jgi:hypothetical protein
MWASVTAQQVRLERQVHMMHIDVQQMTVLQTQLDNLSMQSTLVIGFALAMWGGETLTPLMDDESGRCLFKGWVSKLLGLCFILTVALCVGLCFVVVVLASYLKQAAQGAALMVSTRAAVAQTRVHIRLVYALFVGAVFSFLTAAVLLIWLFAGLPFRVPWNASEGGHPPDEVVTLDNGEHTILCMNVHSAAHNASRDTYALWLSSLNTGLLLAMCAWGYSQFQELRHTYEPDTLLAWYAEEERRMAEEARAREDLRKEAADAERAGLASAPASRRKLKRDNTDIRHYVTHEPDEDSGEQTLEQTMGETYYPLPDSDFDSTSPRTTSPHPQHRGRTR